MFGKILQGILKLISTRSSSSTSDTHSQDFPSQQSSLDKESSTNEQKKGSVEETKLSDKLTSNFTFGEFVKSNTAEKRGIDNTPNQEHFENLQKLACVLEQVRE